MRFVVNTINVAPQTVILKTDQAQVVFEGKSKNYSFELGMYSFAGKLTDLINFAEIDNPIKNNILNSIDVETDKSLAFLKSEKTKLDEINEMCKSIGYVPVSLEFTGAKSYSIQFKNSRSNRLFMLINLLDIICIQALSLETSSMISSPVRHKTIYNCQNKIRRIFSLTYKKIDEVLNIQGAVELMKVPEALFVEELDNFERKDELTSLLGPLDQVDRPIREL